ncbi:spore germination protein [Virgibacillus sp. YIM 98842]|uniref:spore germination protein n=1 Tax=Virgibacillus sp. YIM 98842 TaxID=2663533 RepID=UPI0023E47237|nr:spore germination protein [Virgibacillus sp. YIM 98842]
MGEKDNKIPVSSKIAENESYMTKKLGLGVSYDLGFRELIILKRKVHVFYLTGLCDSAIVQEIIKVLIAINDNESNQKKLPEIIENRLIHQQLEPTETMDEAIDQLLSGLIVVFVNGYKYAFVVDVRNYPGRSPEEPDTERVVRGSRDGYTENIVENTALNRRRIRDARLRHEMMKVGERSKTDVCLSYIEDVADKGLIQLIKNRIKEIEIDGISMADKALEEFVIDRKWNPYPLVRYTERPDVAANHLLEGHVIIIVDTSPSAIILPTTYFHHLQHAEEYRQTPALGTLVRWVRFFAVFLSIYLLPFWLLLVNDPTLLPPDLSYIGPTEMGNIPVMVQILLASIGIEFLRMAAIHTPTPLSTALGLIAAVLIGQIAIDVGLFIPEVILYTSIAATGVYVTPSHELSVANKAISICIIILTGFFGLIGFTIGIVLHVLFLTHMRSLRTPYLWPLIPFNPSAMLHTIFRIPAPFTNSRPSIVHPKNNYRQPDKKN